MISEILESMTQALGREPSRAELVDWIERSGRRNMTRRPCMMPELARRIAELREEAIADLRAIDHDGNSALVLFTADDGEPMLMRVEPQGRVH